MMGSGGIPIQLIQLLGRWSSQAVQRYVQTSHLSVVPNLPAQLLGSRPPELLEDSGLPAPGEGTLRNGLLQHRKQVPTHELMDSSFAGILDSWNS